MAAYYNEHDAQKAAWLRELIARNLIAPGEVDERSIEIVQPEEVRGYTQCHFFAGIGVWSYALRNAGWSDGAPVWTGSCPCQPFSSAGKSGGADDSRHLWPAWFRLIGECRPNVAFGEQVASPAGLSWFDLVSTDLEGAGYAIGAADLCAAGVGAPHIRQRLYFVAESTVERWQRRGPSVAGTQNGSCEPQRQGAAEWLGNAEGADGQIPVRERRSLQESVELGRTSRPSVVGDTSGTGLEGRELHAAEQARWDRSVPRSDVLAGFWADAEWLPCTDGKSRPVEPGSFPLAHGAPFRVVRLRGYGDGIVEPIARAFIEAWLDVSEGREVSAA